MTTKTLHRKRGSAKFFYDRTVMTYEGHYCLIWPFSRTHNGYGSLVSKGFSSLVHRRLCEEINGPIPTINHQASHTCGNGSRGCVTKNHVMWKTKSENERDKILHGTHNRGHRHGMSKLTEEEAKEIKALKGIETPNELSRRFGVSKPCINMIQTGKRWSWL